MGLDAQVIGIGPYSQTVLPCLEYPSDYYRRIPDGAIVVTNVFVAVTSDQSNELARCFGVEAMDLGSHHLKGASANIDALSKEFCEEDVARFLVLMKSGFEFYFLPNG